ncbi:MAG: deoxyguanosinetriphosphate triphosphohydrolase, partial [Clostridiales bacterium]|nr:deoxyguanosinetriphosphate triphosphohydrolase [Clostridiales bacterium]
MTIREELERDEHLYLSEKAQFSDESKGRPNAKPDGDSEVRTCYQRDCDRILHSKSFRRLMHKTQVFLQPEGDHYRTRMTHT